VNAEKPGFVDQDTNVMVGPSRDDVVLRLQPMAVIRGTATDAAGEPVEHALIQVLSREVAEGRAKVRVETSVSTDDRGVYRTPGIAPGRYYVRAAGLDTAPDPDAPEAFAPVYYGGGAAFESASPVTLEPGHDLQADFSLNPQPAYRIRGTMGGCLPGNPAKIELLAAGQEPGVFPISVDSASGAFQVDGVAPGSYVLRAAQEVGDERLRGEVPIQIKGSVDGVRVRLSGAVPLRGVVRTATDDNAAAAPPGCAIKLSPAESWDSGVWETATAADGEFRIEGVLPGRYHLTMDCAAGYVASARMGDSDLLAKNEFWIPPGNAPLSIEAIVAQDGGTIDVTASSPIGSGLAWVALVPASGNQLNTRIAPFSGKFTLSGIAPGDYQAYAWTGSPEAFAYANPDARQAWAGRAVSVHVEKHDRQKIEVPVAAGETP